MNPKNPLLRSFLRLLFYPVFARYVSMPGRSFSGGPTCLAPWLSELSDRLRARVQAMAVGIGERSIKTPEGLSACADYIAREMAALGFTVERQSFVYRGMTMDNLICEIRGNTRPEDVFVLGAHYDTVIGTPGADDNASGVAALLELARDLRDKNPGCTIRFVAFANEENNGDGWYNMGSYHYATMCHQRGDRIIGMLSLEMLGCFSEEEGTQHYPFPFNLFYPSRGNFIGFVGNFASRDFVQEVVGTFRQHATIPSEGVAAPERFRDIARSDHWSFWQYGWPALMITDTSNFRYEHVHKEEDTPDKIDFDSMVRVVEGVRQVVLHFASR
ncbi:MAG: M20/M25/M40 family metallo-hydrolase [Candidatus Melainabacteria bacterium]|nr:M20/M25/M40 family metallo-hydrolase [Candidatus Melainabacteria bacterium]